MNRYPNTVAAASDACFHKREVSLVEAARSCPQIAACMAYICSNHRYVCTCENSEHELKFNQMALCAAVNNRLSGLQITTSADTELSLGLFHILSPLMISRRSFF